jgi:glycosyltransferase involved in cell wall biosynthesis
MHGFAFQAMKKMDDKQKIRVLRIINRFNIGGPTYNATFLTRYLADEFDTLLIGGLPDEGESDSLHILDEYGVKPLVIEEMKRQPSFFNDRKAYRRIQKIIREFKPDIVHTHASKAGALGRRAAIKMNVPVIIHTFHGHVFHSYFSKFKTFIYKTIERRLAKKTTGIIAISELQKKELSEQHKICDQSKITVIPLGFDLNKFHQNLEQRRIDTRLKFDIRKEEVAIAIVGRLAPIKNHTLFLKIIENVALRTKQKLAVFIVGDGSEREAIEQRIQTMSSIENLRIIMTSWILDIGTFNAGMDIMCLTSDNEGTPVSLIEAQAANIPIVATDVGGVRDVVLDGETGFVVPKNSTDAFAEKLFLLIEDEKIRTKMSQNGWNYVENKFHYSTLANNMKSYYYGLRK